MATQAQEADGTFGGHRRWAEGAGHNGIKGLPERRVTGGRFGPLLHHFHPIAKVEVGYRLPEKLAATNAGVQKYEAEPGTGLRQHQAGHPAAAPEVEQAPGAIRQAGSHGPSVVDMPGQWSGTEKPLLLGLCQNPG